MILQTKHFWYSKSSAKHLLDFSAAKLLINSCLSDCCEHGINAAFQMWIICLEIQGVIFDCTAIHQYRILKGVRGKNLEILQHSCILISIRFLTELFIATVCSFVYICDFSTRKLIDWNHCCKLQLYMWNVAAIKHHFVPAHQTYMLPEQPFKGNVEKKQNPFALLEVSVPSEWF